MGHADFFCIGITVKFVCLFEGTRHAGGKDSASPRYIFTFLNPVTRTLFHPADDDILKHLDDDGQVFGGFVCCDCSSAHEVLVLTELACFCSFGLCICACVCVCVFV